MSGKEGSNGSVVDGRYLAFGLRWRSDIALPELRTAPDTQGVDVDVRLGPVPPLAEPFTRVEEVAQVSSRAFVLDMAGVARFGLFDGSKIVVEPYDEASPADIRAHLLGSITGALLLQRGLLPLHASAALVEGKAVAIVGASGAGKSTLALALHERGWPLLCDDICALDMSDEGPPLLWPGLVRLKLWGNSLDALNRPSAGLDPVPSSDGKFSLAADRLGAHRATPLHAIYVLERAEDGDAEITPMRGAAAFGAIVSNSFRGLLVEPMGKGPGHFARCAALARACPVFALSRPWNIAALGVSVAGLLDHIGKMDRLFPTPRTAYGLRQESSGTE